MCTDPENDNVVADACRQIGDIILDLIKNSTGDVNYGQATANMRVFRRTMVDYESPDLYNDFLRDLKKRLLNKEIDQRQFWPYFRYLRLGLIDLSTSEKSDVTEDAAEEFMKYKELGPGLPTRER